MMEQRQYMLWHLPFPTTSRKCNRHLLLLISIYTAQPRHCLVQLSQPLHIHTYILTQTYTKRQCLSGLSALHDHTSEYILVLPSKSLCLLLRDQDTYNQCTVISVLRLSCISLNHRVLTDKALQLTVYTSILQNVSRMQSYFSIERRSRRSFRIHSRPFNPKCTEIILY